MTALRVALILFAALAFLPIGEAAGQIVTGRGPVGVEADYFEGFNDEGRGVFTGNVDITQDGANLRADRVEVSYARDENGQTRGVERILAQGDVYYITATGDVARGETAIYDLLGQTVLMSGDVVLTRGENVFTGHELLVDLTTGNSEMRSAEGEADDGANARVRAVFVPADGDDGA